MTAALPLWALDTGQVEPVGAGDAFEIDIFNTNTSVTAGSRMRIGADGTFVAAEIPGVDGAFPGVDLFLANPVGAKTGRLLPTGQPVDDVAGYPVSCVDVAVPMVIARAADFGKTAHEKIEALEADRDFMAALRTVWVEAGLRMALKGAGGRAMTADELAQSETIPKVCIVGPPQGAGHIAVRYFTPQTAHRSMAVSGGCCLAAAALIPGSVAHGIAARPAVGRCSLRRGRCRDREPRRRAGGDHRGAPGAVGAGGAQGGVSAQHPDPAARTCAAVSRIRCIARRIGRSDAS